MLNVSVVKYRDNILRFYWNNKFFYFLQLKINLFVAFDGFVPQSILLWNLLGCLNFLLCWNIYDVEYLLREFMSLLLDFFLVCHKTYK